MITRIESDRTQPNSYSVYSCLSFPSFLLKSSWLFLIILFRLIEFREICLISGYWVIVLSTTFDLNCFSLWSLLWFLYYKSLTSLLNLVLLEVFSSGKVELYNLTYKSYIFKRAIFLIYFFEHSSMLVCLNLYWFKSFCLFLILYMLKTKMISKPIPFYPFLKK